ncbi:MAG: aldehyde dehydrogenase, partial [Gammaproteobacteria bacterium]|nr:aldehyde dehydrogenase [Gammaproteobacteria bacterium]
MSARPEDTRVSVAKTYKLYIGGKFPRTESGRHDALRNADNEIIANVSRGSRKDFREAVVAARTAVASWSGASAYL